MGEIVKKQVCRCENCGNEAEMHITCSLPEAVEAKTEEPAPPTPPAAVSTEKVKGTATCTHCGNEADMWIDV